MVDVSTISLGTILHAAPPLLLALRPAVKHCPLLSSRLPLGLPPARPRNGMTREGASGRSGIRKTDAAPMLISLRECAIAFVYTYTETGSSCRRSRCGRDHRPSASEQLHRRGTLGGSADHCAHARNHQAYASTLTCTPTRERELRGLQGARRQRSTRRRGSLGQVDAGSEAASGVRQQEEWVPTSGCRVHGLALGVAVGVRACSMASRAHRRRLHHPELWRAWRRVRAVSTGRDRARYSPGHHRHEGGVRSARSAVARPWWRPSWPAHCGPRGPTWRSGSECCGTSPPAP